jgi:hypothetical protein
MRAHQFLLREYSRDITAQNFGPKILSVARKDRTIPQGFRNPDITDADLLNMVMTTIEESDPTKNKEYAQALAKLYGNNGVRFEDLGSTVAEYLIKFHKLKQKKQLPSPRNDFMRYTDIGDFYSVVDEYPDPTGKQQQDKGQAKAYYEDSEIRVIVPEDQTAACYYGQGTRWCTAGRTGNMFNHYSSQGPLYIVVPKQPKLDKGEKYQFHFETGQYMDAADNPISLKYVVANYPSLRTAFAEQAKKFAEIDLMTPEQARPYVEENKKRFVGMSKDLGGGIRSVNVEDYDNDATGFNDDACRVIRAVTGKDPGNTTGLNIGWAGDHAWALVSTKTGELQVVYTDMEGFDVYVQRSFDLDDARWDQEIKDENLTRAAEELRSKLKWFMELNTAGDPSVRDIEGYDDVEGDDDELDAASNAMAENPDADQETLDQIFAKYGTPANRNSDY